MIDKIHDVANDVAAGTAYLQGILKEIKLLKSEVKKVGKNRDLFSRTKV